MKKVLVVNDSALMRRIECDIINSDPDFQVIDVSLNIDDAYDKIKQNKYDIVVLEMVLRGADGLDLLRRLKDEQIHITVIAVSTPIREDAGETLRALEMGAYDFVARPARPISVSDDFGKHLLRVMHNSFSEKPRTAVKRERPAEQSGENAVTKPERKNEKPEIVALACSTGGPQALYTMIPMLPKEIDVPIVIVQHMPTGFTEALSNRLNELSRINVKEAEDGDILQPGWIYIAPGGKHMEIIENQNKQACVSVNKKPPVNSLRPCADVMYESLIHTHYKNILCVVLTGMGADGTKGIIELGRQKNVYVITESQESCVVYGMPKSLEQKGLSDETFPIEKISEAIVKKLGG